MGRSFFSSRSRFAIASYSSTIGIAPPHKHPAEGRVYGRQPASRHGFSEGRRGAVRPAKAPDNRTGPPIARRPCASIPSPAAPGYTVRKKAQQPEGSGILHCVVLHEQTFYPFELEACLARPMVVFDPRHALIPQVFFCHGALHGSGAPMRSGGEPSITAPWSRATVSCFTWLIIFLGRLRRASLKPIRCMATASRKSDAERLTDTGLRVGISLGGDWPARGWSGVARTASEGAEAFGTKPRRTCCAGSLTRKSVSATITEPTGDSPMNRGARAQRSRFPQASAARF